MVITSTFILCTLFSFNCAAVIQQVESIVERYPVTYFVEDSQGDIVEVDGWEENSFEEIRTVTEKLENEYGTTTDGTNNNSSGTSETYGKQSRNPHGHLKRKEKEGRENGKGKETKDSENNSFEITGDDGDVSKNVDKRDAGDGDKDIKSDSKTTIDDGTARDTKQSAIPLEHTNVDDGNVNSSTSKVDTAMSSKTDTIISSHNPIDEHISASITPSPIDSESKGNTAESSTKGNATDSQDLTTPSSISSSQISISSPSNSTTPSSLISSSVDSNSTMSVIVPDVTTTVSKEDASPDSSKIVITSTATIPASITTQPNSAREIFSTHYTSIMIVIILSIV